MTTLSHKIAAELKVRQLLDDQGIPVPDRVEYGYQCVRLFWDGPKIVLVVDLDDDGAEADDPVGGDMPDDALRHRLIDPADDAIGDRAGDPAADPARNPTGDRAGHPAGDRADDSGSE